MEQMNLLSTPEDEIAKSLLSNLLDQSRLYHQSKDYKELLDFITRLRNFAPFNAFLLNLQKPGLRFAASQYDWRQRFGREVKEGARPLLILWPFGPVALVYNVDDTEGEPLPDSVLQAFRAVGELTKNHIIGFMHPLQGQGIELKLIEYGDAHAGHIQSGQKPEGLEIGQRSTDVKKRPAYLIRVNPPRRIPRCPDPRMRDRTAGSLTVVGASPCGCPPVKVITARLLAIPPRATARVRPYRIGCRDTPCGYPDCSGIQNMRRQNEKFRSR